MRHCVDTWQRVVEGACSAAVGRKMVDGEGQYLGRTDKRARAKKERERIAHLSESEVDEDA